MLTDMSDCKKHLLCFTKKHRIIDMLLGLEDNRMWSYQL